MAHSRAWRILGRVLVTGFVVVSAASCQKDPLRLDRNRPPNTYIISGPGNAYEDSVTRSYRVHLYWRGEDPDGYVAGYYWSFNDSAIGSFRFTTKTDSIFEVTVNDSDVVLGIGDRLPGTTRIHTFFVRAVDNLGKADPNLAIWNRRNYRAETFAPKVRFLGGIPSGTVEIDTLCDGTPFRVCWTGNDSDGVVTSYRVNVGPVQTDLSPDTCVSVNDRADPKSISLGSGLYTLTVTAVDNALALGNTRVQLVVNRDPETWIEPKGSPKGYYIQHFLRGQDVRIEGEFAQGETVPFRSTVYWRWDGGDNPECEPDSLTGWSAGLQPGTRNGGEPYTIGFLDEIAPGQRFKTNDPAVLGPLGLTTLICDSLDAGYGLLFRVASRDGSSRADGTPAPFIFNCNFPPELTSLSVNDVIATPTGESGPPVPAKRISWVSEDYEDGLTKGALVTIDGVARTELFNFEQEFIASDARLRELSPAPPYTTTVEVRVRDRAGIFSGNELSIQFDVP